MSPDPDVVRGELVRLCRHRKTRKVVFTKEAPSDWRPTSVAHPEFGQYFTDAGAWEYVADLLEKGHAIKEITLSNPVGELAYEMNVDLGPNQANLYIKIQIKSGFVFGRSFHYSYL